MISASTAHWRETTRPLLSALLYDVVADALWGWALSLAFPLTFWQGFVGVAVAKMLFHRRKAQS